MQHTCTGRKARGKKKKKPVTAFPRDLSVLLLPFWLSYRNKLNVGPPVIRDPLFIFLLDARLAASVYSSGSNLKAADLRPCRIPNRQSSACSSGAGDARAQSTLISHLISFRPSFFSLPLPRTGGSIGRSMYFSSILLVMVLRYFTFSPSVLSYYGAPLFSVTGSVGYCCSTAYTHDYCSA